jgi:hypothetical protein
LKSYSIIRHTILNNQIELFHQEQFRFTTNSLTSSLYNGSGSPLIKVSTSQRFRARAMLNYDLYFHGNGTGSRPKKELNKVQAVFTIMLTYL